MNNTIKSIALKIPKIRNLYDTNIGLRDESRKLQAKIIELEEINKALNNKTCSICNSVINRYNPLPDYYFEESKKHGYPILDVVPETLNRIEYTCPVCGAADRERLYALYIEKYFTQIQPAEDFKFLDIAPAKPLGNYINSHWNIDYRTMDLFMDDVTYHDDLTNITSIGNDEIDFVLCSHVLEHVSDDKKALSEMYRIMKPNAHGIIMVPLDLTMRQTDEDLNTSESERWARFGQGDHVRKYAKQDFIKRLYKAGFLVVQFGMQNFGMDAYWRNGLLQSSMLYLVEKPDAFGIISDD